jgi:triacylglycerol esterase/lipase EstA (alpha/beta hydrolase family)
MDNKDQIMKRSAKNYTEKFHLFILAHGLQGHSIDMRNLKNILADIYPKSVILVSVSNQNDTESVDIETMGFNLANEIKNFLKEWHGGIGFEK